jgi:hypothetical protein
MTIDTSSVRFQQYSSNIFCEEFTAYLFSMVEIPRWNLSECSSLTAARFGGKKSKWECKKWIFSYILHPIVWYAFNKSSESFLELSAFTCLRKFILTALNSSHADYQFPSIGVQIDQISLICGPIKVTSFNLPSLSFENVSLKYSKPLPCLFVALTKFSINPMQCVVVTTKCYLGHLIVDFWHNFPLKLSFFRKG